MGDDADDAQRLHEQDPSDHMRLDVQMHTAIPSRRAPAWIGWLGPGRSARAAATWRGLAAVASIALAVGLLATLLATGAGNRPGGGTTFVKPTLPPTATPAFPTPTLPPTSPAISAEQAWGPNAAIMTLDTQLDATHVFRATAISPDGRYLLGYAYQVPNSVNTTSADAGFFDLATRRFTSIGITQSSMYPPGCCTMDEHYLLVVEDTAPGATCGLCHRAYDSYDLNTKTLWRFAKGTDYGMVTWVMDDHGLVLLATGQGIEVVDLASHRITPLPVPVPGANDMHLLAFTWPSVAYSYGVMGSNGIPSPGGFQAHDFSTGRDIPLPQLDQYTVSAAAPCAIFGETLFLAQTVTSNPSVNNNPRASVYVTTLFEDDAFSSGTPHSLKSYAGQLGIMSANSRLVDMPNFGISGETIVWDRAQSQFIQVGTGTPGVPSAWLAGNYLAVMQLVDPNNGLGAQRVTIYDTNRLSTTPGS